MDNSFLKLYENDFNAAVMNDNIAAYQTRYTGFAQLLTYKTFCQITNCDSDIAFGGNLKAELIDICQTVKKDITENFFYTERVDIYGVSQIKYVFGMIGEDFGDELLFLKLTHTVSDKIWYSAGFFVTDNEAEFTEEFHYGNGDYFAGISYDKFNGDIFSPQWINLQCFRDDKNVDKQAETQIQINGRKSSSRSMLTPVQRHIFCAGGRYVCDSFTFERLVTLLNHNIIYLNGYRISDKPDVEKEDRIPDTNGFGVTFTAAVTEEKLPAYVNLYESFDLIDKSPLGTYTLDSIPPEITGVFNKPVTMNAGSIKLYRDNILFATFTTADIIVSGNGFTIDTSGLTFTNAAYYLNIDDALFSSGIEIYGGILNNTDWDFTTRAGDYDDDDYDGNDYF